LYPFDGLSLRRVAYLLTSQYNTAMDRAIPFFGSSVLIEGDNAGRLNHTIEQIVRVGWVNARERTLRKRSDYAG
jgi:hypothetical protein